MGRRLIIVLKYTFLRHNRHTKLISISIFLEYRKVPSSNMSGLEAHAGYFRLLMRVIFDPIYIVTFWQKVDILIFTRVRTRNHTVLGIYNFDVRTTMSLSTMSSHVCYSSITSVVEFWEQKSKSTPNRFLPKNQF